MPSASRIKVKTTRDSFKESKEAVSKKSPTPPQPIVEETQEEAPSVTQASISVLLVSEPVSYDCSPLRQALRIIDHRIRNLEKKKSKQESQPITKSQNADQSKTIAKLDELNIKIEMAKDFSKQFAEIVQLREKEEKKKMREEVLAKRQGELAKIREILLVQDALSNMGADSVREDFLHGRNGAATLTQTDLDLLDEIYTCVTPKHELGDPTAFSKQVQSAAEHLLAIVDGLRRRKVCTTNATYAQLKEVIGKIHESGYLDQVSLTSPEKEEEVTEEGNPQEEAIKTEEVEFVNSNITKPEPSSSSIIPNNRCAPIVAEQDVAEDASTISTIIISNKRAGNSSTMGSSNFTPKESTLASTRPSETLVTPSNRFTNTNTPDRSVISSHSHQKQYQNVQPQQQYQKSETNQMFVVQNQQQQQAVPVVGTTEVGGQNLNHSNQQRHDAVSAANAHVYYRHNVSVPQPVSVQKPITEYIGTGSFDFLQESEIEKEENNTSASPVASLTIAAAAAANIAPSLSAQTNNYQQQYQTENRTANQAQNQIRNAENTNQVLQRPMMNTTNIHSLNQQAQQQFHSSSITTPIVANTANNGFITPQNQNVASSTDSFPHQQQQQQQQRPSTNYNNTVVHRQQTNFKDAVSTQNAGVNRGHRNETNIPNRPSHQQHQNQYQQNHNFYSNNNGYNSVRTNSTMKSSSGSGVGNMGQNRSGAAGNNNLTSNPSGRLNTNLH